MSYEYLSDADFLKKIDLQRVKTQHVKLTLLTWDEKPKQDIIGKAVSGSINIDGSSACRRTANFTFILEDYESSVMNIDNLISINKKMKLEVGFDNITNQYTNYDIIWYPMGIYVITSVSISHSTSGITISVSLKDKMCLLDGSVGGTLPAAVSFNEMETYDTNGNIVIEYPTIYQIIQELVNHWGGEQLANIIISDIDTRIKRVMKWTGETSLWKGIYQNGDNIQYFLSIDEKDLKKWKADSTHYTIIEYPYGYDVGYIYSDFYYPSDLSNNAGESITSILDKIKNTLGNYEYFYDVDGKFIFQEIKNYLNTSYSTIEIDNLAQENYIVDQSKGDRVYDINSYLVTSFSNTPSYENIKNDFIIWGKRDDASGTNYPIRYHLTIDEKPKVNTNGNYGTYTVLKYTDPTDNLIKAKPFITFDNSITIDMINKIPQGALGAFYLSYNYKYKKENGDITTITSKTPSYAFRWDGTDAGWTLLEDAVVTTITATDWRTALYLEGASLELLGTESNYYYTELQSEWPKHFNIWATSPNFYSEYITNPENMDYYLDFIDSTSKIGEFNVSNIGRRTYVLNDDSVNCLFEPEIPNFVLIENSTSETDEKKQECEDKGQDYILVNSNIYEQLATGGNFNSAYDTVRALLYQYTGYNEAVTIQCLPIYHLEPNTRIGISDPEASISGEYIIKSISIPLDINSTMSITANRAIEKI